MNLLKNILISVYNIIDFRRLSELHFKSDWEKTKTIAELVLVLNGFMLLLVYLAKPGIVVDLRHDYDPIRSDFIIHATLLSTILFLMIRLILNFSHENKTLTIISKHITILLVAITTPIILSPNGIFDAVIWMIAFAYIMVGLVVFSYKLLILPIFLMLITFGIIAFNHDHLPFKLRTYILGDHSYIHELSNSELLTHIIILYTIVIVITTLVAFLTTKNQHREIHLRDIAEKDPLTGILNRRSILDFLNSELEKSRELGTALSLAMIDLDYFKRINDQYGHPFGDSALIHVASEAKKIIRSTDAIGRFGGEEFLVVLTNCQANNAGERINKLRSELHNKPLLFDENEPVIIKLSAGISEIKENINTSEALIAEADKNLYDAKNKGRDQVIIPD